jgi:hypothetical protein
MFKLGEYYEDDAKSIVKYLKDAKIRVEQKTFLCAMTKAEEFIEGRLNDLTGKIEDIGTYERYLKVLKAALSRGAKPDDFRDLFLSELDPAWNERKDKLSEIFKDPNALSDEELKDSHEMLSEKLSSSEQKTLYELISALDFALSTLSRNEIEPEEDVGDRLDNPIIRVKVDEQDCEDTELLKSTVYVKLEKQSEIFIDEFTSPLFKDLDDQFEEEFPEEYLQIMALGLLVTDLVEEPSFGKIEMQDFIDRCDLEMEKEGDILNIDATENAEEIAKVLEKNGIIKFKGETIKWKTQPKEENR